MSLRSRNAAELALVVEAACLLGLIRVALPVVSFATLRRSLDRCATRRSKNPSPTPTTIAWAIKAASRRLPVAQTCLTEALAADVMLRRRGYDAELRLGVRRRQDHSQQLDGHAWVACGGDVVMGNVDDLAAYSGCLISCPRG
jgi:transglutaminase superfamily protein